MPKRKRLTKRKLAGSRGVSNATRWLQQLRTRPASLVDAYSKRYAVTNFVAREELVSIGYHDDILIQEYENDGIEWEYRVEPLSSEMIVVPRRTAEHELIARI
jgi:hypothetical protein